MLRADQASGTTPQIWNSVNGAQDPMFTVVSTQVGTTTTYELSVSSMSLFRIFKIQDADLW